MQLTDGGLPIVHSVELLDWMAGGPEPGAVAAARERRAAAAAAAPRAA
jgi:glycolate oxidase iron-sulfur subunit